jgi:hypothetical protein
MYYLQATKKPDALAIQLSLMLKTRDFRPRLPTGSAFLLFVVANLTAPRKQLMPLYKAAFGTS